MQSIREHMGIFHKPMRMKIILRVSSMFDKLLDTKRQHSVRILSNLGAAKKSRERERKRENVIYFKRFLYGKNKRDEIGSFFEHLCANFRGARSRNTPKPRKYVSPSTNPMWFHSVYILQYSGLVLISYRRTSHAWIMLSSPVASPNFDKFTFSQRITDVARLVIRGMSLLDKKINTAWPRISSLT